MTRIVIRHGRLRPVVLAMCLGGTFGCASPLSQVPASPADVLRQAVQSRAPVRVFAGDSGAEGRAASLGMSDFRVDRLRVAAASVDSIFVRQEKGPDFRLVVAGAGIGTLAGLLTQVLLASVDLAFPGIAVLPAAGAFVGGTGVVIESAETSWVRRWPPPTDTLR